ncbi:hypothetical protein C362_00961 [Cryptococcus neoformans Bt1]|nr:hypothetical protein C362_00961 [Cryptococcus neoformans var. grubii Bt1]
MQGIYSEQVHHQSAANDQVEQDVMDDADGEEDEDGASEVVTREERTQLMAEVNGIEEFVRLRKDLGYDDAGPQSPSSIKLYVVALVDLWGRQKTMGMNYGHELWA